MMLFNILYYDEIKDEEKVEEVAAYSEEQALFLFNQQMKRYKNSCRVVGVECVNRIGVM